jgi:hypothetical protein
VYTLLSFLLLFTVVVSGVTAAQTVARAQCPATFLRPPLRCYAVAACRTWNVCLSLADNQEGKTEREERVL